MSDEFRPEEQPDVSEYAQHKCPSCDKITPHGFVPFEEQWSCRRCGAPNKEITPQTAEKTYPDPKIPLDHSSSRLPEQTGSWTLVGPKNMIAQGGLERIRKLNNMTATNAEKRQERREKLFNEICAKLDFSSENKKEIRKLWVKTLDARLAMGMSALANDIAVVIIMCRILIIHYDWDHLISNFEDPKFKNSRFSLQNKVWDALKKIESNIFSIKKINCEWCISTGERPTKVILVDKNNRPLKEKSKFPSEYKISCPRMQSHTVDGKIIPYPIPKRSIKEDFPILLKIFRRETEFPQKQTLERANEIFDLAFEKALTSGSQPETISAAIILLAINENSQITISQLCETMTVTPTTLKKAANKINDSLNLGIIFEN